MAARHVFWVSPLGMDWRVHHQGGTESRTFPNKEDAIGYARRWAYANKPSQVKVQTRDGRIETEWTYENDPVRYPG